MNNVPTMPEQSTSFFGKLLSTNSLIKLLAPLEKLTRVKGIPSDNTEILTQSTLTKAALDQLFQNKISAIHIPNYFSSELSQQISEKIIKQELANWYVSDLKREYKESDFFVYGMPFNMALRNPNAWKAYFETKIGRASCRERV